MKHLKRTTILVCMVAMAMPFFKAADGAEKSVKSKTNVEQYKTSVWQSKMFGVGAIVGEPIGLSLKYWWDPSSWFALQGGVGFDWSERSLAIWVDGLRHWRDIANIDFPWENGKVNFYGGVGAKVSTRSSTTFLAVRLPLGVENLYGGRDWTTGLELAPAIRFNVGGKSSSGTSFIIDAGGYVRKYF